jgi:hypothetical protein
MVKDIDKLGEWDFPGQELADRNFRDVAQELVKNQGWGYKLPTGGGYPKLYPPDKTQPMIPVPKTPSPHKRSFANFLAQVKRSGGIWPVPPRKEAK